MQIDLNAQHATTIRTVLAEDIAATRSIGPAEISPGRVRRLSPPQHVRVWARQCGISVEPSRRVADAVWAQYVAAKA